MSIWLSIHPSIHLSVYLCREGVEKTLKDQPSQLLIQQPGHLPRERFLDDACSHDLVYAALHMCYRSLSTYHSLSLYSSHMYVWYP